MITNDVHIAAIDNGLAFPFKHPDEWRGLSISLGLGYVKRKFHFLRKSKLLFSPLLSDMNFVQNELCDDIQRLFLQDKHSDRRLVEQQLSVMRGQILNLVQAMRDGKNALSIGANARCGDRTSS